MEDSAVKRLGLILAVQAEIEGLKAENEFRKAINDSVTYGEEVFIKMAEEIRTIVYKHPDQL